MGITNRATVIIDKDGIVRYVKVYDIPTVRDNEELLKALEELK
jgi:alkyl hydroperoxide reductase subunit AhpC